MTNNTEPNPKHTPTGPERARQALSISLFEKMIDLASTQWPLPGKIDEQHEVQEAFDTEEGHEGAYAYHHAAFRPNGDTGLTEISIHALLPLETPDPYDTEGAYLNQVSDFGLTQIAMTRTPGGNSLESLDIISAPASTESNPNPPTTRITDPLVRTAILRDAQHQLADLGI